MSYVVGKKKTKKSLHMGHLSMPRRQIVRATSTQNIAPRAFHSSWFRSICDFNLLGLDCNSASNNTECWWNVFLSVFHQKNSMTGMGGVISLSFAPAALDDVLGFSVNIQRLTPTQTIDVHWRRAKDPNKGLRLSWCERFCLHTTHMRFLRR